MPLLALRLLEQFANPKHTSMDWCLDREDRESADSGAAHSDFGAARLRSGGRFWDHDRPVEDTSGLQCQHLIDVGAAALTELTHRRPRTWIPEIERLHARSCNRTAMQRRGQE